jgi:hypothetical protein
MLTKAKSPGREPINPVYVVTENHYAEGFTPEGDTARFGDLIAVEIFNPKTRPTEEDAVYNVGERVALFVGGSTNGRRENQESDAPAVRFVSCAGIC